MKTGIELISEERKRQIDVEKYDVHRDVEYYEHGELLGAAGCYISSALNKGVGDHQKSKFLIMNDALGIYEDAWPWASNYDKRKKHGYERSLIIAGALIAAELDRIQNLKQP